MNALTVSAGVAGQTVRAMIDTGCSVTLIGSRLAGGLPRHPRRIGLEMMDRTVVRTQGSVDLLSVIVHDIEIGPIRAHVLASPPRGVDLVLGLDVALRQGLKVCMENGVPQVTLGGNAKEATMCSGPTHKKAVQVAAAPQDRKATWAEVVAHGAAAGKLARALEVKDDDFHARFTGMHWEVRWRWKGRPPEGRLHRVNYRVPEEARDAFNLEVEEWIQAGYLVSWDQGRHGEIRNIVPLLCVQQRKGSQSKVRPVLDFRWLNDHVDSRPAGATPLCQDRLREWRRLAGRCAVVDLKKAYLQVRIPPDLWTYQAVWFGNRMFLLTRLGFGLNITPKAMTAVVECVLGQKPQVRAAASSYIDDVMVNEDILPASQVVEHLARYGLEAKAPERLGTSDGARVLGLRVTEELSWRRDSALPIVDEACLTRREVHQLVGEWLGHLPVGGWLRVACGYLQRCTAKDNVGWDDKVSPATMQKVWDVARRLRDNGDPASGRWHVRRNGNATLWVDASCLALGALLQVDGDVVEDAAWLKSANDAMHINLSELEAAIRGINMARKWGFTKMRLHTDSATVFGWLRSVFEGTHNVRTRAMCELLIRRHLDVLRQLRRQENLQVEVVLVPSSDNIADRLTRVPKKWLSTARVGAAARSLPVQSVKDRVMEIHQKHHFGVDRMAELARQQLGDRVSRQIVKEVVRQCDQCARVCPNPLVRVPRGGLSVHRAWSRVACDITHVQGRAFLTLVDCASGFASWRVMRDETSREVRRVLLEIFAGFGPPEEILSDNGTAF